MKALTAYASGANEAREIRGFALAGFPIGASASQRPAEAELRSDWLGLCLAACCTHKQGLRPQPRMCWTS